MDAQMLEMILSGKICKFVERDSYRDDSSSPLVISGDQKRIMFNQFLNDSSYRTLASVVADLSFGDEGDYEVREKVQALIRKKIIERFSS